MNGAQLFDLAAAFTKNPVRRNFRRSRYKRIPAGKPLPPPQL
jgi:hypothetical protein